MRFSFSLAFAVQAQAVVLASDKYENGEEQSLLMQYIYDVRLSETTYRANTKVLSWKRITHERLKVLPQNRHCNAFEDSAMGFCVGCDIP